VRGRCVSLWLFATVMTSVLSVKAQEASTTLYVRTDSDHTTVITPRLHVAAPVDDSTRLDLVYTADVWTSASIDIRASASKVITERRDEIHAIVSHDFEDISLSGGYRYSIEPDYESHAVSGSALFNLAAKSTTVLVGGSVSLDTVGRVGDPGFSRSQNAVSAQVELTQLLDPNTLVQAVYELGFAQGYLASPYRFVGVGSFNGICGGFAGPGGLEYCVPETNPDERLRHAALVRLKRALGEAVSMGLAYRFYIDDWNLISHTAFADLSWLPDADTLLVLRYRFYLQGAAFQYRPTYLTIQPFMTRDKELSAFSSHRLAVELEHSWNVGELGRKLRGIASVGSSVYLYQNFPPLARITALEVTLSWVLTL
jgi:hypothetical protein